MAALLFVATAAGAPGGALTDEVRRAFEWFDGLEYPDLAKAPFVRIYTGRWEGRKAVPEYGFLLGDDGKRFRVFTVGLRTLCLTSTGPREPAYERVAYERIPLADYVRAGLQRLANPPEDESPWEFEPFGHREFEPTQWFRILVFARACGREGHPDLAQQLWMLIEADQGSRCDGTVLQAMQKQVAWEALRCVVLDFGDPERSWADLLVRCRWWKEKFAAVGDPAWVDAITPMIERIVAAPADEPESRVARLILRLRDASSVGLHGVPEGAGEELVRIGLAAVPQLLDAWDDERPTRCIQRGPVFKGYHRRPVCVLRVGTHVSAIVEQIAGRRFEDAVEARLWDAGVRGLEERAVLVRLVSEGCRDAWRGARLLRERHPDAAEAAILTGLANVRDSDARSALVAELRPIRTDAATRLLLEEIRVADPDGRAVAAWLLLDRGRADGVAAVAEAWRGGSESVAVSSFLCSCGRSEAVAAVQERFDSVSLGTRFDIVGSFIFGRWWPLVPDDELPAPDAKWDVSVESLLVHALADTHRMPGWTGWRAGRGLGWGPYTFSDPRVCDVAASALREMFPDRYDFAWEAVAADRDRQILAFRNGWRAARGLPTLPAER